MSIQFKFYQKQIPLTIVTWLRKQKIKFHLTSTDGNTTVAQRYAHNYCEADSCMLVIPDINHAVKYVLRWEPETFEATFGPYLDGNHIEIAPRWVDKNKRLKWEFFLDAQKGPWWVRVKNRPANFGNVIKEVLPYWVEMPKETLDDADLHDWIAKMARLPWTIWATKGLETKGLETIIYAFQKSSDATLFKLKWVG